MSEQIPTAVASSLVWHDRTHAEIRDAALPSLPDGLIYGWMTTAGTIYAGEGYPVPPRSFSLDNVSCAALLIRRATPTPAPDAVAEGLRDAMENDPFADDIPLMGTSQQSQRIGHYVSVVLAALAASQPDKLARDYTKQRIGELIEEGDGDWVACSGCQESVDGCVSTKDYPYDPVFRCQPGGGCSECGGIGVLWRDRSYYAMWEQEIPTSQPVADVGGDSLATVERVETVPMLHPFDDAETDPIWRVLVGEYVADFDYEQAARNFAGAINGPVATLTARVETLVGALRDLSEDWRVNTYAKITALAALSPDPAVKPSAEGGDL